MNEAHFLAEMENILELEAGSLTLDTPLVTIRAWDSLALIGVVAYADKNLSRQISISALVQCATLRDIASIIASL